MHIIYIFAKKYIRRVNASILKSRNSFSVVNCSMDDILLLSNTYNTEYFT